MPRKKKNQNKNGTTHVPGADFLPPTVNRAIPKTRVAQKETAIPGERSNGLARESTGTVTAHRGQVPALELLHDGAKLNTGKQDSETGGKGKIERTDESHVLVERNLASVSSTVVNTKSRPKPSTLAAPVAARRDGEETARDLPLDKISNKIMHELRQKPEEGVPGTEACPPSLGQSTKLGTEERVYCEANIQSLKDFPKSFKVPGPSTLDLVPISAKGCLEQEHIIETTQRQFAKLPTPSMMALQCGLGAIRHYTYPKGTPVPFQTLRNLGRGSMAHVEEVYIPPHESFVRKTFLLTMSRDSRLRCRDIIHREIQVMSQLSHMHIVKVIGSYDLEPFTHTILMFPVGDSDLKMFFEEFLDIPRGNDEWSKTRHSLWKWVGCLTSAIAYIHGQGICHKDIKPSNIVYKGDTVYLTDFSSCGQFHIGETTSTAADARTTLVYRAPELFRTGDAGKHGPGTDVFALGLVFLEMKTVYWGTSIQHLRESYAAAAGVKSSDHSEFSYGKALIHIHEELERNTKRGDNEAWPLSSAVILLMLAFERKERPRAVQVLNEIRFESAHDSCVCTMSNATSDIRFS